MRYSHNMQWLYTSWHWIDMKYFSFCVKFQQYVSTPSSSLEKTRGPWTWNRHTRIRNVGKSLRKSQVHLVFIVRVGGNLKERKPLCWGPGHTWNVADVALRITKALLNRTWFCTGGSTVNLLNLYATMLRVDVEEEDSVLLGAWYPERTCDGRSHTYILVAHSHPPWF